MHMVIVHYKIDRSQDNYSFINENQNLYLDSELKKQAKQSAKQWCDIVNTV